MKNRINIIVLFLCILLVQLPIISSAQDSGGSANGNFVVKEGATVNIGEGAKITVAGNLILKAAISGRGVLIIDSKRNTFIDANNYTVENLMLASANTVELKSGLQINSKLIIQNGSLQLNDFNITINYNIEPGDAILERIIENGLGKIIQNMLPVCKATTPFTYVTTVNFDFVKYPATITDPKRNSSDNKYYYNLPVVINRNPDIFTPPPKA